MFFFSPDRCKNLSSRLLCNFQGDARDEGFEADWGFSFLCSYFTGNWQGLLSQTNTKWQLAQTAELYHILCLQSSRICRGVRQRLLGLIVINPGINQINRNANKQITLFLSFEQPSKEVSVEKSFKTDEEDGPKPKPAEAKKVNHYKPLSAVSYVIMLSNLRFRRKQNSSDWIAE